MGPTCAHPFTSLEDFAMAKVLVGKVLLDWGGSVNLRGWAEPPAYFPFCGN